jgi:hypothetical protein
MKGREHMTLSESGFQSIQAKIEDIQANVDHGLTFTDTSGFEAITALRIARIGLFDLRSLLREHITISPPGNPEDPEAA